MAINFFKINKGASFVPQAAAPGTPENGDVYYDSVLTQLRAYVNNTWTSLGAGSAAAAGSTGEIQFNNGGVLGADSLLFWDNTNKRLGIGTSSLTNKLTVGGTGNSGVLISSSTASATSFIDIGQGGTGNRFAFVDLVGDDTYTDYGLRLIRNNTGANTSSELSHRGTGILAIAAVDAGSIELKTSAVTRLSVAAAGTVTSTLRLIAQGTQTVTSLATATGSLGGIEVTSNGATNPAFMAFHRPGGFATYFGLDTDNIFKVGGWSYGATVHRVFHGDAPGSAPVYACRAWVVCIGTGTPSILGSGNVSSVGDAGVGVYTINMTTAMPDANYACAAIGRPASAGAAANIYECKDAALRSASQINIQTVTGGVGADHERLSVMIFR